jgi:AcrR family transcriptional regulator
MKRNTTSRTRLLASAESVFYEQGIAASSIDMVAKAAGVTKPTVYAHFPSKSALAAAGLDSRRARRAAELDAHLLDVAPGEDRLLAAFTYLTRWYEREGGRGCAFLNAATEPATDDLVAEAVRKEKQWLLDTFADLARAADLSEPDRVASALLLLLDGLAGRVVVFGPTVATTAAETAVSTARALLATARPRA